jgi:hypothetical protein
MPVLFYSLCAFAPSSLFCLIELAAFVYYLYI